MQIHALAELGVAPERIYVDKRLTGANRPCRMSLCLCLITDMGARSITRWSGRQTLG